MKAITGKPIKFVGVGEKLDRLDEFHPDRMASRILGMGDVVSLVERAGRELDQKQQQEFEEKIREAQFDLDDFLKQLQSLKRLGSLKDLLGHLPGMGGKVDQLDLQGNEMQVVECIIQSMTHQERQRPEIINTSRRQRIARGAGRELTEVNDLLKQFKQMRAIMSELKGGKGMFGKLKAMKGLKRQLGGDSVQDIVRDLGPGGAGPDGMPPGMPGGIPGMMPPGAPGAPGGRTRATAKSVKDLRKKRKDERKRRRKSRKR